MTIEIRYTPSGQMEQKSIVRPLTHSQAKALSKWVKLGSPLSTNQSEGQYVGYVNAPGYYDKPPTVDNVVDFLNAQSLANFILANPAVASAVIKACRDLDSVSSGDSYETFVASATEAIKKLSEAL